MTLLSGSAAPRKHLYGEDGTHVAFIIGDIDEIAELVSSVNGKPIGRVIKGIVVDINGTKLGELGLVSDRRALTAGVKAALLAAAG